MHIVTCIAPVNIAVIKYWGKRHEKLIIPLNDSLSATLSMNQMHAKTTIMASPHFKKDRIWLNGQEDAFNDRLLACVKEIRNQAKLQDKDGQTFNWSIHVCSENNFPTAAGLASSAAGYACFVFALAKLFKVTGDLSAIARQGSGSACRSLEGGFVRWHAGTCDNGSDSIATQVVPPHHWPEMRVIILVVNDKKKKVSSTSGMQRSVETSELLQHRIKQCVPQRIVAMEEALHNKNFETFAEITMRDSNQFHAVALDTYPPAVYMNDISHSIVDMVHCYNQVKGSLKVAYTFDAGPNACLYLLESEVAEVMTLINHFFPAEGGNVLKGITIQPISAQHVISAIEALGFHEQGNDKLKYIIHTSVGEGPRQLMDSDSHLLTDCGMPKQNHE